MWVYRGYKNIQALNADKPRFSPGWAVGGFFIPIYNFIHPLFVMIDLWKSSNPLVDINDRYSWKGAPISLLVYLWWLLLAFLFVGTSVHFMLHGTSHYTLSPQEIISQMQVARVIDGIGVIYLLVSSILVNKILQRQERKNVQLVGLTIPIDRSDRGVSVQQLTNGKQQELQYEQNASFSGSSLESDVKQSEIFNRRLAKCPFCNGKDIYDYAIKREKSVIEENKISYIYLFKSACSKCDAIWYWRDKDTR